MTIIDLYEIMAQNRADIRKKVVIEFLKESAGTGSGEKTSRYEYNVEKYSNYKIVLKRPGTFKKGFDFTVNIRGIYFKKKRRYENPSFDDIKSALNYTKKHFQEEYSLVKNEINHIFNVEDYDLSKIQHVQFKDFEGNFHPIAIILLAIKWLFISEDISYWNWSGRNMFMKELKEKNFA